MEGWRKNSGGNSWGHGPIAPISRSDLSQSLPAALGGWTGGGGMIVSEDIASQILSGGSPHAVSTGYTMHGIHDWGLMFLTGLGREGSERRLCYEIHTHTLARLLKGRGATGGVA